LHGRDPSRLIELARACEALGARVVRISFDLRDAQAAVQELRLLSERESIDLVIVNAGVTRMIGAGEQVESWEAAREVLAVNLDGALATVAGVLPQMRRKAAGQIALVSSLAAYYGLPQTPVYCASKAAQGLRRSSAWMVGTAGCRGKRRAAGLRADANDRARYRPQACNYFS